MKFTKRAYVKVWQSCPEDEREDTTITLLDYLAYKHQSNRADILRTLKLEAEAQPTFDLAELNQ